MRLPTAPERLDIVRCVGAGDAASFPAPPNAWGALVHGCLPAGPAHPANLLAAPIPLPLLDRGQVVDFWTGSLPLSIWGEADGLRWSGNADWLWASTTQPASAPGALEEATALAYRHLFDLLGDQPGHAPVRYWNYIPRINEIEHGLERYRRFNTARQAAFMHAGIGADATPPAACALGMPAGEALTVHMLASRRPALRLENPRQVPAYHYPGQYGPQPPRFSRATLVDAGAGCQALFISGTASIVGHETLHRGDLRAQCIETTRNLLAVLQAADAASALRQPHWQRAQLACTVYLRRRDDQAAAVQALREAVALVDAGRYASALSSALDAAVWLQADICRADLLLEIEAHGVCGPGGPRTEHPQDAA